MLGNIFASMMPVESLFGMVEGMIKPEEIDKKFVEIINKVELLQGEKQACILVHATKDNKVKLNLVAIDETDRPCRIISFKTQTKEYNELNSSNFIDYIKEMMKEAKGKEDK